MSEMPPEQPGGGMMSQRIMGMPAPLFIAVVALAAYLLFFRNSGSSAPSGTGGSGTPSTGDITLNPGTTSITVNDTSPVTNTKTVARGPGKKPVHRTPNPQPRPKPKPKTKTTSIPVAHKAQGGSIGPAKTAYVTVGKWTSGNAPWNSTLSGIASHSHTTVAELLKLNPGIKNPNLIHPGEKIRIK